MNASSQIVATYREMLPAWVTEDRVRSFLRRAPEDFSVELQAAIAREEVLPGPRTDVPDLLVEWLAADVLHEHRDQGATQWDGVPEISLAEYAARLS
ncbi:hypothetical protein BH23ACT9_BH23ACT9_13560 [soil metagenome]